MDTTKSSPILDKHQRPVAVFGTHDKQTLAQLADVASRADRAAIMADGHFGYIMPVGGVAGYRNQVSAAGVGFDIGCGNAAILTNLQLHDITQGLDLPDASEIPSRLQSDSKLNALADAIQNTISFGIGRRNQADDAPLDDPLFADDAWYAIPDAYRDDLRDKARRQLGTVGSGNHYVDVFVDEVGSIWVGVHFGSRGFGHTIASNFFALAQGGRWGERAKEVEALLDLDTPMGQEYWALMNLAGRYAYAGREWVARKVVSMLGGREDLLVHNHHNFAWKEMHGGEDLVVVRKGATPAFPGQMGFVGGSMGDNAVILAGASPTQAGIRHWDNGPVWSDGHILEQQFRTLYSTVHGAGRVMARNEAIKGRVIRDPENPKKILGRDESSRITPRAMHEWLAQSGVVLRGAGVDEAPQAYRRLPDVLADQGPTVNILHTLRPIIVVMAGANEHDPYKD